MNLEFSGFDWDAGNIYKCQKHGLSREEVQAFFYHNQYRLFEDKKHSASERRLLAIGQGMHGRWIYIAFVLRGTLIRPVSARYMHEEEVEFYEKEEDTAF